MGFGTNPPPEVSVVDEQTARFQVLDALLPMFRHGLKTHSDWKFSFGAEERLCIFRPRGPNQRRPSGRYVLGDPAVQINPLLSQLQLVPLVPEFVSCNFIFIRITIN